MNMSIDFTAVVPSAQISGHDEEEDALLKEMLMRSESYVQSFRWCHSVKESFYGIGVAGVIGVFLFRIHPASIGAEEWVWVVVGDVPPAYIAGSQARNPAQALDGYIGAMNEWVIAVQEGKSIDNLIPVDAPPTQANASSLKSRLDFIDREILDKYLPDL